jgi:sorbose reductase
MYPDTQPIPDPTRLKILATTRMQVRPLVVVDNEMGTQKGVCDLTKFRCRLRPPGRAFGERICFDCRPGTMPLAGPPKETNVLSLFRLNGKVAVVTGGTRGIGWEASKAMAEAGADVALVYTSYPDPEARIAAIKALGVNCRAYKSDTGDATAISDTLDQIVKDLGKIDIVVANAGICKHTEALEYTVDYWQKETNVNINGNFYTAQAAGRIFQRQGHGNLLFTASISGTIVNIPQCQAAYNASKAAIMQLAKSLAIEWVDFCRVNTLSPGYIRTDMTAVNSPEMLDEWHYRTPAKRMADPAELKGGFLYLVSDASSYTTGIDLIIDGGYTAT